MGNRQNNANTFESGPYSQINAWNSWDINAYSQMTGLSAMQIQQIYAAFQSQSAATGGRMTINQFKNLYASIAGLSWNFDNDAERIFLMFDRDGNGVLSFEEFLMAYLMLQRGVSPVQRWSYIASSYPVSQPGYLSAQEAQLLYGHMRGFYNFPEQNYYSTAWSQLGGGVNGYVPTGAFVQALVPLIPQTYIW